MIASTPFLVPSWSPPIAVNASLGLSILVYAVGWIRLRRAFPRLISGRRFVAFLFGIAGIWCAIGSPLEAFDDSSLTVHMVQHLLLMSIAPPLILLGWPAVPVLRGLPRWLVRRVIGPVSRSATFKWLADAITQPFVCWSAAAVALVAWHVPSVFEAALRWDGLHELEHASFLAAGLLFWWPVVQPWPSTSRWPRWSVVLYLFCATLPCDVLSAFLVFCGRVVYPSYLSATPLFGFSPLQDQECAASLMWVAVTLILLVPAAMVTIEILSPTKPRFSEGPRAVPPEIAEGDAFVIR
jgi:putative membrane protein